MKKSIFCLIFSITFFASQSFAQDTIWIMINGTNMHEFNQYMKITKSTDHYNDSVYKDYKINIDKDQVLSLDLYDSCKYCKNKSIDNRKILIEDRVSGKITLKKFASSNNVYFIDGNKISSIIVCKPNLNET